MHDRLVFEIQRLYPQIYLACHVDHVRASSTEWQLSSRDAAILAHLNREDGTSPRVLAEHLGIVPSTLSATVKRLSQLGYISNEASKTDSRRRELKLTNVGMKAMAATSVLDADQLRRLIRHLSPGEQQAALKGLTILAQAANKLREAK